MEVRERPLSTADLAGKPGTRSEANAKEAEASSTREYKHGGSVPIQQLSVEKPHATDEELVPLFSESAIQNFRARWTALQTEFVDEPRRSVEHADEPRCSRNEGHDGDLFRRTKKARTTMGAGR